MVFAARKGIESASLSVESIDTQFAFQALSFFIAKLTL